MGKSRRKEAVRADLIQRIAALQTQFDLFLATSSSAGNPDHKRTCDKYIEKITELQERLSKLQK